MYYLLIVFFSLDEIYQQLKRLQRLGIFLIEAEAFFLYLCPYGGQ